MFTALFWAEFINQTYNYYFVKIKKIQIINQSATCSPNQMLKKKKSDFDAVTGFILQKKKNPLKKLKKAKDKRTKGSEIHVPIGYFSGPACVLSTLAPTWAHASTFASCPIPPLILFYTWFSLSGSSSLFQILRFLIQPASKSFP